jgi:phosphoribosylformylglycinamidine synthase
MKNDSTRGGRKISIPPSVLFSAIGKIDDMTRAITMEAKSPGDLVYVLGFTRAELGGSEYAHLLHDRKTDPALDPMAPRAVGGAVPRVDPAASLALYRAVEVGAREALFRSLHAVGLGGLAAAFSMVAMGGELGLEIDMNQVHAEGRLSAAEILFSESAGRFIATVAPENRDALERALAGLPFAPVGLVTASPRLIARLGIDGPVVDEDVLHLKQIWKAPLADL